MTVPLSVIVSSIAAVLATVTGVVLGSRLGSRSQASQWARAARLEACSDVLRTYSAVYDNLSSACRRGTQPEFDWTLWNQAIALLSLVESRAVMDSALQLDEAIWRVDHEIELGRTGLQEWLVLRELLEHSRVEFVNAVRRELGSSKEQLLRVIGRPDPSDPLWIKDTYDYQRKDQPDQSP